MDAVIGVRVVPDVLGCLSLLPEGCFGGLIFTTDPSRKLWNPAEK